MTMDNNDGKLSERISIVEATCLRVLQRLSATKMASASHKVLNAGSPIAAWNRLMSCGVIGSANHRRGWPLSVSIPPDAPGGGVHRHAEVRLRRRGRVIVLPNETLEAYLKECTQPTERMPTTPELHQMCWQPEAAWALREERRGRPIGRYRPEAPKEGA